jgi:hypothetical protein
LGLRRREPLHERLAREGGLVFGGEQPPHGTQPRWGEVGIHGLHRPREWDALGVAQADALPGDELAFVVLPDGTVLVDDDLPDDALAPLAESVEQMLSPPYRARAVRRAESLWAVAANAIEVVELPEETAGVEIDLTLQEGRRTLVLDGERAFGRVQALERLGEERGFDDYVVHAEHLDGALWMVEIAAL